MRFLPAFHSAALKTEAALAALAFAGGAAQAETIYGLTTTNALVTFDCAAPANATLPVNITGLSVSNEAVVGIDARPANGTVVGLSNASRLYVLNTTTGAATFLSLLGVGLTGTSFGVDFNPTLDRLRLTSNSGQNLRFNVDTGAVTVDTLLNGAASGSSAAA